MSMYREYFKVWSTEYLDTFLSYTTVFLNNELSIKNTNE